MKKSMDEIVSDKTLSKLNNIYLSEEDYTNSFHDILIRVKKEDRRQKIKRFTAIAFPTVLVTSLLFVGLNLAIGTFFNDGNSKEAIIENELNNEEDENLVEPKNKRELETKNTSKDGITSTLNDFAIEFYEWAPNERLVSFIKDSDNDGKKMFIWEVGKAKPKEITELEGLNPHTFYWSPNSHYVLVAHGFSSIIEGKIISGETFTEVGEFSFLSTPVWSPDSEYIAFGSRNDEIKPVIDTEINTIDLAIYDMEEMRTKIAITGMSDYYYVPDSWINESLIQYSAVSFENPENILNGTFNLSISPEINAPFSLGTPLNELKEHYGAPSYDDYYNGGRLVMFNKEGYIIDERDNTVSGYYFSSPTLSVFGATVGMTAEEINNLFAESVEPFKDESDSNKYVLAYYYKNGYKIFFESETKNGPTNLVWLSRE